ncbi:MAG: hypothetical protein OXG54_09315 [Gammaproteobacteria bacterium]|nr:hypothetical protein [Gammaproteobacteria bacterium]
MSAYTEQPPATPEEIWAILREITRKQEEAAEQAEEQRERDRQKVEQDRQKAEQDREQDRQKAEREIREIRRIMAETAEENRKRAKEADIRLKKAEELFTSQWGKLVESLVEGKLVELLQARNIDVYHTSARVRGQSGAAQWEYDVVAHNGEEVVVVEVKSTMKVADVRAFLAGIESFKQREWRYQRDRVYGAMAYLRADESAAVYAERQGLFVIRATGDSASIINKDTFRPRSFG